MTVRPNRPTPSIDSLSILAVTSHRPAEIAVPVDGLPAKTETLCLDASRGALERSIAAVRKTRAAIERHDPDILILDVFETIGAPVTFVAGQHDIPVISRLVGNPWRKLDEERLTPARQSGDMIQYGVHRVSKLLNQYIFRESAGFIAVSSELVDPIQRQTGCPPERIGVVPVPLTAESASGSAATARERFGLGESRVVLTVTNLSFRAKRRGVEQTVTELLPLFREQTDLVYVVAGGGNELEALRNWLDETIADPSLRRRIHTPGYVDDVADLYAVADVFTYVSSLDGYPNVVLEAQFAGLPVVANDAHGMRDQITDGQTGMLVDTQRVGSLRRATAPLLQSAEKRDQMGTAARERVQRENSPEAVTRQLSAAIEEITANIFPNR